MRDHIHLTEPEQRENIVILSQENFKKVVPEESLLNLEELVRHVPRDSAKVVRDLPDDEENFEELESKKISEKHHLLYILLCRFWRPLP